VRQAECEDVAISALKKSDADSSEALRAYEIEGRPADTAVAFLGAGQTLTRTNLLEEDGTPQRHRSVPGKPGSSR
jgi:alpha-mannosidase